MGAFFTDEDAITNSTTYMCPSCGLTKKRKEEISGEGRLKTLIITNSPEDDDNGSFLADMLSEMGLDLKKDFWKTPAILCRTPREEPSQNELTCCFPHIQKAIRDLKPHFIWLMGESAIQSFYQKDFSDTSVHRWRGLCIPDYTCKAWIMPTESVSEAFNKQEDSLFMSQYKRDLKYALNCIKTKGKLSSQALTFDNVRILKDFNDVCEVLDCEINNPANYLFFDYETTGLKPYRERHKIATMSFTTDRMDESYSFPFMHPHWTIKQQETLMAKWQNVLMNKSKKVAHNIQFEEVWSQIITGVEVNNWHWCTMLAAHSIDNRKKYSGLKFQSYIHWGVPDYSKEIKPYLEDIDENGFNRVFQAPLNKLLFYGGIDAYLTKELFSLQKDFYIDSHLDKGLDLFIEGSLALADVQMNGINVDTDYYKDAHKVLEKRISEEKEKLLQFDECKLFYERVGRDPNLGSSTDLRLLFFDILGLKPPKTTENKNYSVDADTLSKLKTPLAKEITALNKIKKIDGTYMKQFLREIDDDGRIHPFFNLGQVLTYRSSSDKPNLQNVPVRNEEAKRYSRSGIRPSPGNVILDFDYSGIEVKMGACYTKDPVLVDYCKDPKSDMHGDTARIIFEVPKNEKPTKDLRFYTKNGLIFPIWYGSYYKNCARNIWRECSQRVMNSGITVFEHLKNVGIITKPKEAEREFTEHIKNVEAKYWKRFKVFKEWQTGWYEKYEKTGFVELLTGFRCSGYMSRNAIVNYAFQGTAFHCLLWSLTQLVAEFKDRGMKTKVIGQIHDCSLFDAPPEEVDEVIELGTEIATKRIKEQFDWIIVPVPIEWEKTEIDGSWYAKEELKEV